MSTSTQPKISAAQKALIAERTNEILKTARPGSKEYADACAERAEAGLAVPKVKYTAVDVLSREQFREELGSDLRREMRQRTHQKPYGLWLSGWFGLVAAGMTAYVFLGPPPARALQPVAEKPVETAAREATAPTSAAAAPIVTVAPSTTAVVASATATESSAPPPPTVSANGTGIAQHPIHVGATAPPVATPTATLPTAPPPPTATPNAWAPAWKKP